MEIEEKYRKIKEKIQGIDNMLSMNWKHILGDNACVRRSSRGIKIEYQNKKEGNRRKGTEKELEVPLESFRIDE
jgi:hypothetical protein